VDRFRLSLIAAVIKRSRGKSLRMTRRVSSCNGRRLWATPRISFLEFSNLRAPEFSVFFSRSSSRLTDMKHEGAPSIHVLRKTKESVFFLLFLSHSAGTEISGFVGLHESSLCVVVRPLQFDPGSADRLAGEAFLRGKFANIHVHI
jgi:hypothetical protein